MNESEKSEYTYRKVQGIVGDNSLCVVLPKYYAINIGIRKGDYLRVKSDGKRLIMEKDDQE